MDGSGMFTGSTNRIAPSTSESGSMNTYQPTVTYGLEQRPIPHQQPSLMTVHYGLPQLSKANVSPSFSKPGYCSDDSCLDQQQPHHHRPGLNSPIDATKLCSKSESPRKMSLGSLDMASGETCSVFPDRPHSYRSYYADSPDDGPVSKQMLQKALPDGASNSLPVTLCEMESSFITSPILPLTSSVSKASSISQHLSKMASMQSMSSTQSMSPSQTTSSSMSTAASYFNRDENTHNTSAMIDVTIQNTLPTILDISATKPHKIKSANVMHVPPPSSVSSWLDGQSATTSSLQIADAFQLKMPPVTTSSSAQPSNVCKPLDNMSMTSCPHCHKDITSVVVSTLMVAGVEKLQPSKTKCENCCKQIFFSPEMAKPFRAPSFLSSQDQAEAGHILPCPHCPKLYKRSDKLTIHIRSHTGERPFPCTYCGRGFARKDKLKLHIRIHTGEKPYQCNLCEKCFYRGDKLKNHRMKAHLDTIFRRTASEPSIAGFTSSLSPIEKEAAAAAVSATVAEISNSRFSPMTQETNAKFTSVMPVERVSSSVAEIMPRFSINSHLSSRFNPSERDTAVSLNVPQLIIID